jgi:Na+-translocating ferredoxin:NAD+ oxidoreductase RnfA subunit
MRAEKGTPMIAPVAEFLWITLFIVLDIIFLLITMTIARSKGHSPLLWGLLAVFFPLITIIIVLLMPAKSRA